MRVCTFDPSVMGSIASMSETPSNQRTVSSLSTGAKIALMIAVPFVLLAAYFFFTPVSFDKSDGGLFYCGSPGSPNKDAVQLCSPIEGNARNKAFTALGSGLATGALGLAFFGVNRRQEEQIDLDEEGRGAPARSDWDDAWEEEDVEAWEDEDVADVEVEPAPVARPRAKTTKPAAASKTATKAPAKTTAKAPAKKPATKRAPARSRAAEDVSSESGN